MIVHEQKSKKKKVPESNSKLPKATNFKLSVKLPKLSV